RALPCDRAPNLHPRSRRPPAAPRRTPGSHASAGGGAGVRPARVVRRGPQGGTKVPTGGREAHPEWFPAGNRSWLPGRGPGRCSSDVQTGDGESGADVTETRRDTGSGPAGPGGAAGTGRPMVMLVMATLGFALNFWAWALLSPLAPRIQESLGLTSFEQSLLVAVPVIVGSLGRIPVGALTDRFGGRVMFPALSLITIAPVLYLGFFGRSSLASLLVGGFFLGVAGTVFAVGVPFVSAWFPPERRGLALGVFGAGMGGTAITALTTIPLVDARGIAFPFALMAVVLAVY